MTSANIPDKDCLLAEYSATNQTYMHYDSYSWQVGSVLTAGTFVFWGFVIGIKPSEWPLHVAASWLVSILMSLWYWYAVHNRQIYLLKLHRIHQIEQQLGMQQHSRFRARTGAERAVYTLFGLSGHRIDLGIYLTTSLGAILIGILKFCLVDPLVCGAVCSPVILVLAVLLHARQVKDRSAEHRASLYADSPQRSA